jgi:hypothetical protein
MDSTAMFCEMITELQVIVLYAFFGVIPRRLAWGSVVVKALRY